MNYLVSGVILELQECLEAYKEIIEDRHPVIILAGCDIVEILKQAGFSNKSSVQSWLRANFPMGT